MGGYPNDRTYDDLLTQPPGKRALSLIRQSFWSIFVAVIFGAGAIWFASFFYNETYRLLAHSVDVRKEVLKKVDDINAKAAVAASALIDTEFAIRNLPDGEAKTLLHEKNKIGTAALVNLSRDLDELQQYLVTEPFRSSMLLSTESVSWTSTAWAKPPRQMASTGNLDGRKYFLAGMLAFLGFLFIAFFLLILTTRSKEVLKFSMDSIKTLLGFAIGAATNLM